jgi:drug/metabolite transporter (DMT)-like permease
VSTTEFAAPPVTVDLSPVVERPPVVDGAVAPPAPAPAAPRTSRVVLRRVEPWSVLKLSLVFYLCVCAVLLVAATLLWIGASITGVVGNVESFFRDAGFDGFRFSPPQMLRAVVLIGLILVVTGTLANLLLAKLFNVLSDTVGGIRITLAEDVAPQRQR